MFKKIKSLIKYFCYRIYSYGKQYEREIINKSFGFSKTVNHYNVSFEGNISIGSHTYINERTRIDTGPNAKITIGKHCAIGRNVHISAKTHNLIQPTTLDNSPNILHIEKDVTIGDYVWIGDNVLILPGVSISSYAVIGANSLVNRDVKAFEIVGGTPIKHIRFNKEHVNYSN